jgi:MFS transporter, CP family, cyanate transporter
MTGQSTVARAAPMVITGIVLVAATMRGPFVSVGPLLETIRADLGLSSAGAGALGMVPLLAFAAVSPLAPGIARRIGFERAVAAALAILTVGVVLRSVPGGAVTVFAGTVLIGVPIGMINVLLSGLIKRDQPGRAAALTGLYTTVMGAFAMIGSGLAVPVADAVPGGWRTSLGLWAVVTLIALVAWLPQLRVPAPLVTVTGSRVDRSHWRSPLAWQLTAFMGLQSLGFYVAVSWLPTILHTHGRNPAAAGWYLALMQLTGLLASAVSPWLVRRASDQRLITFSAALLGVLSYLGFVVAPGLDAVWSGTVGLSQGVGVTLALSMFALRARDAGQAAALSGMGQSLGYLLAAVGPVLFGVLHDAMAGWSGPLIMLAALIGVQALVALGAGRDRLVGASP